MHQFSIHNRVVDEWFPIITARGFALYSMYCRMASKEEERCYPGYRLIAKHMGMGISTISDYNKLLVWCGLLHIEPGDRNSPNDYYILDIPEVTPDVLARIGKLAKEDVTWLEQEREAEARKLETAGLLKEAAALRQKCVGSFYSGLLKRLQQWEPIYAHWGEEKERPFIIKSGQLSLFPGDPVGEHPDPGGGGSDPVGEHPDPGGEQGDPGSGSEQSTTTIHNNNLKQQSTTTATTREPPAHFAAAPAAANSQEVQAQILDWMGFNGRLLSDEQAQVTNALLLAWAWWVKLEAPKLAKRGKNAVGIARAGWRRGDAPGNGLLEFAEMWLTLDEPERLDLLEDADSARFRPGNRLYEAERMSLSDTGCHAFYRLWVVTEGVVAPPVLMPKDDEEGLDVE